MSKLLSLLEDALDGKALDWLGSARSELETDASLLPQIFPQLPRKLGRQALGDSKLTDSIPGGDRRDLDLAAWRRCDAGALDLLILSGDADLEDALRVQVLDVALGSGQQTLGSLPRLDGAVHLGKVLCTHTHMLTHTHTH